MPHRLSPLLRTILTTDLETPPGANGARHEIRMFKWGKLMLRHISFDTCAPRCGRFTLSRSTSKRIGIAWHCTRRLASLPCRRIAQRQARRSEPMSMRRMLRHWLRPCPVCMGLPLVERNMFCLCSWSAGSQPRALRAHRWQSALDRWLLLQKIVGRLPTKTKSDHDARRNITQGASGLRGQSGHGKAEADGPPRAGAFHSARLQNLCRDHLDRPPRDSASNCLGFTNHELRSTCLTPEVPVHCKPKPDLPRFRPEKRRGLQSSPLHTS